jgi:hypothetical protein
VSGIVFGDPPAFDLDALIASAEAGELTDADRELITELWPQIEELMQATLDAMLGILMPGFGDIFSTFASTALGIKTYRTEPIPGAELGGRPRNPEADVIDEIDHLVDWQLKSGGGW